MTDKTLESNSQITEKILLKFLLPSIFALMASNLSSMIDTIIVGNYMAEDGLAAMSLVSPLYLIYFMFGSLMAVGSSIMASICLGKNNKAKAESYFGAAFFLAVILGIGLTVFGLTKLDAIVALLGAKGELVHLVRSYCLFYIAGGTCTLLFYIPFNFLRIMGKPQTSMYLLLTMGIVNILLTWCFVHYCNLSTGGAALATIISLLCAFLLGCYFMFHSRRVLKPRFPKLSAKDFGGIISAGSAAALNNLTIAILVAAINYFINRLGVQNGLTIYTVTRNIYDLFMTVIFGISQAVVPIISLYYGEKDNLHIRSTMKESLLWGVRIVSASILVIIVFSQPLIRLFGVTEKQIISRDGRNAVICVAVSLLFALVNNLTLNYYSATRKTILSNMVLVIRMLSIILWAYLLSRLWGLQAIWFCYIGGEISAIVIGFGCNRLYGRLMKKRGKECVPVWLLEKKNEDERISLNFSTMIRNEDISFASEKLSDFCALRELPPRKCMLLSLALEELLVLIQSKVQEEKEKYADVRVYIKDDTTLLRIRYPGMHFNPIQYYEENPEQLSDSMGVGILVKSAESVEYSEVLGVNNLLIIV